MCEGAGVAGDGGGGRGVEENLGGLVWGGGEVGAEGTYTLVVDDLDNDGEVTSVWALLEKDDTADFNESGGSPFRQRSILLSTSNTALSPFLHQEKHQPRTKFTRTANARFGQTECR